MVHDAQMAPEVYDVIDQFHQAFADSWVARQVGAHMSCSEADALAEVLALVDPEGAQAFLYGHANGEIAPGDSEGDEHYWMRDEYDAAARDADHRAQRDNDEQVCHECGQPCLTTAGGLILHRGLDELTRTRWRKGKRDRR